MWLKYILKKYVDSVTVNTQLKSGGKILVEQIVRLNTDLAFFVPGESYLDVLNSMYDKKKN